MKTTVKLVTLGLSLLLGASMSSGPVSASAPAQAETRQAPAAAAAPAGGFHLLPRARVTIPSNYVYNPNATYQRTLHDYCSYSPDEYRTYGTNANFRGPCARHDMCYQYHQKSQSGCDNQLGTHLVLQCEYTYAWYDPRRAGCIQTAGVYWAAVTIHTIWP